MNINYIYIIT